MHRKLRLLGCLGSCILFGCGQPAGDESGDPGDRPPVPERKTTAWVEGRVVDNDSAAVAGATVQVIPLHVGVGEDIVGECEGRPLPAIETESEADGSFGAEVVGPPFEIKACLTLDVEPPTGSALLSAMRSGVEITLRPPHLEQDTARLVMVLPRESG